MPIDRDTFLPFGAQYYRAPTPPPECWEKDLDGFAAAGFNTIKTWPQWRWNEPVEGQYDFSDIVRLTELAAERDLAVVPNIICDVAPAWFFRKYPDCHMVTNDGRTMHARALPHRQIGGCPGPSFLHKPGQESRRAFCRAVAEALRPFDNILIWDLWNEPQLMCMWAGGDLTAAMLDFSIHSQRGFMEWLRARYDLGALNARWGRNYQSWEEVEVPRLADCFGDMIDWRCFLRDTLTDELVLRKEGIREGDPDTPVMCHTVPWPHFYLMKDGTDDAAMAEHCDWFGNSVGTEPYGARCTVSAAPDKRCIASEIHAIHGLTYDRPPRPDFNGMKRHLLSPLSHGVTGFLFWQYKPETIGRESPAWGLTDGFGEETPWMASARRVNDVLQANRAALLACRREPADTLVVKGVKNEIFDFCAQGNPEHLLRSVQGTFLALHDHQYQADIVTTEQLGALDLSRVRVIYYPFPYLMERETAEVLRAWVHAGGTLISEAFFGAFLEDTNRHAPAAPGYGFEEVFGAREGRVMASRHIPDGSPLRPPAGAPEDVALMLEPELAKVTGTASVRGYLFSEALEPTTADVLARFGDGQAAITRNGYGSGQAIWMGSLVGRRHTDHGDDLAAKLIAGLVELGGARRSITVDPCGVRVDLLAPPDGGDAFLVLGSRVAETTVSVTLDGAATRYREIENLLGCQPARISPTGNDLKIETRISAGAWELFLLRS